ncbi:hypothetical protein BC835DRAFT_1522935 [Cytidiella melzeri]|nr:hypothetical protein BC835DRAFT_1522935 [Cytidiella melzeri]
MTVGWVTWAAAGGTKLAEESLGKAGSCGMNQGGQAWEAQQAVETALPNVRNSDGNLQDAPRIKNCLNAALLPFEFKTTPPATPADTQEKARNSQIPPTSVVNLIFVLFNASHALQLTLLHFEPPVEFLHLCLPINLSSVSRAKPFLSLIFHYLSVRLAVDDIRVTLTSFASPFGFHHSCLTLIVRRPCRFLLKFFVRW